MYVRIGTHQNARRLADTAAQFHLQPSREGYATSACEPTRRVYQPLLEHVFPGEWTHCLLSVIWQNGSIPPHCDGDTVNSGSRRFHIVIQSNPNAWALHDGEWQRLDEDGIYTMDPVREHAAVNWGQEPRIHLIADVRSMNEVS